MQSKRDTLNQLVEFSSFLGRPENDLVIYGEGNTSAKIDEETFFVKASGHSLKDIGPEGFVEVRFDTVFEMLEKDELNDAAIKEGLMAAAVGEDAPRPSVETFFHAALLKQEGINFVAHTHATAVVKLLCSTAFPDCFQARLYPDEIVVCGLDYLLIPYTDPGLPLSKAIMNGAREFLEKNGEPAKVVLIQNHGPIAVGKSAVEAEKIMFSLIKACEVLTGALSVGGAHFLTEKQALRIHTRPDEHHRQRIIREETG